MITGVLFNTASMEGISTASTAQVNVTFSFAKSDYLIACARYGLPYTTPVEGIESVYSCPQRDLVVLMSARLYLDSVDGCSGCHALGDKYGNIDTNP